MDRDLWRSMTTSAYLHGTLWWWWIFLRFAKDGVTWWETLPKGAASFEEEMKAIPEVRRCKREGNWPCNTDIACCYCYWLRKFSIDRDSNDRSCWARWCLSEPTSADFSFLQNRLLTPVVLSFCCFLFLFCFCRRSSLKLKKQQWTSFLTRELRWT